MEKYMSARAPEMLAFRIDDASTATLSLPMAALPGQCCKGATPLRDDIVADFRGLMALGEPFQEPLKPFNP
jgi:hypothetical protein